MDRARRCGLEAEYLRVNGNPPVCLQTSETGSEGSLCERTRPIHGLSDRAKEPSSMGGTKRALSFVSTIQPRGGYNASVFLVVAELRKSTENSLALSLPLHHDAMATSAPKRFLVPPCRLFDLFSIIIAV
ncbi:hypothetical protein ALC56_14216 [Trachymyrmex septentrionalis]|uniref:Uncharacterized protein n=1 Tax=Trachymyrmex septentrionalis TaxID=34720 RepID=A0A195ESV7_9HYME|nr:hypothetical protein ALC56_14216 [Trachymyrmex septentrionalis]